MDYSKLSDAALEQISSGKPLDYSKLDDSDLEQMAGTQSAPPEEMGMAESLTRGALDYAAPIAGALGGGLLGSGLGPVGAAAGGATGYAAGKELGRLGKHYLLGDEMPAETLPESAQRVGGNFAEGAAAEVVGPLVGASARALSPVGKFISSRLGSAAEKAAVNATGATGAQMQKFRPNAGRELLDRGIVKFGDSPKQIASRAEGAMSGAESQLDDILSQVDKTGPIAPEQIAVALEKRISELRSNPATAGEARQLEGIRDNILESLGTGKNASTIESWKRSFGKNTNWNDPEKALARKEAYDALRTAVEDQASSIPGAAEAFKDAKSSWGLLSPIREASERRAATLSQAGAVGLRDLTAGGAGALAGDPTGGIATAAIRRVVAPRLSSSAAVTLDKAARVIEPASETFAKIAAPASKSIVPVRAGQSPLSQVADQSQPSNDVASIVKNNPEKLGKYAPILQQAQQRGGDSLATTHFLLSKKDPEYQKLIKAAQEQ
jgi:hypothetical protein